MPAEGTADTARAVSNVQDLVKAAGTNAVQAVQYLGLTAMNVVALVADLALHLIAGV